MSDTPRTDEALSYNKGYPNYLLEQVEKVSRQLEREIAKLKHERDEAYERAAKVCEHDAEMHISVGSQGAAGNLYNAADSIRALKPDHNPTEGK